MALIDTHRASLWTLFICGWICHAYGGNLMAWEGEPVTLKCAHEVKEADIFWKKLENGKWKTVLSRLNKTGNTVLPQNSRLKDINVSLGQDGSLIIQTASYPTTNGTFRYVSNGQQCEVSLSVYQKMLNISIDVPDTVQENSDMSVTCEVKGGNPPPDIIWDIPERFGISEEKRSAHQSKIILTVTKDDNNKEIGCKASNPRQTLIKKYRFNITYKPTVNIKSLGNRAFYMAGDKETLVCSADANPKPEITWKLEGKIIKPDNHGMNDSSEDDFAVNSFLNVTLDYNNRSYSCTAKNSLGFAEAFIKPNVFGWIRIGLVGAVTASGLALIIAGMWFCYRQCYPKLGQLCAAWRQGKQHLDNDVDSQGYQSQAEVARFFESLRIRHIGSIGDAQSCRTSDPSAAVGGYDTGETGNDVPIFATTSMARHDSSEYLHARSTPVPVAAGRDIVVRPKQFEGEEEDHYLPMDGSAKLKTLRKETVDVEAEVHYLPMDGSAKLKTKSKETEKQRAKPTKYLIPRDSCVSGVYVNEPRTATESAEDVPEETDDSSEYLHDRNTPAQVAGGRITGARPKEFKVEAEVHYLPMDGSAKLKTMRKETEKRRAKPIKSRFLPSVPTIVFENKTFPDTYGSRGTDLIFRDTCVSGMYANEPKNAAKSVEDVPEETDFDLSGIIDSHEFASQPARDTQPERKLYKRTGDFGPIGEPCCLPSRSNTI